MLSWSSRRFDAMEERSPRRSTGAPLPRLQCSRHGRWPSVRGWRRKRCECGSVKLRDTPMGRAAGRLESLGLHANSWSFLSAPERYVAASIGTERPLVADTTRRQFRTARDILARLNGSHGLLAHKGI